MNAGSEPRVNHRPGLSGLREDVEKIMNRLLARAFPGQETPAPGPGRSGILSNRDSQMASPHVADRLLTASVKAPGTTSRRIPPSPSTVASLAAVT